MQSLVRATVYNGSKKTFSDSISVLAKERSAHSSHLEDERFAGSWRREGPLPPLPPPYRPGADRSGFSGRPGQDGEGAGSPLALSNDDWRSNRASRLPPPVPERERSGPPRKTSVPPDLTNHPAHTEITWAKGSKFQPSVDVSPPPERKNTFSGRRGDGLGSAPGREEVDDWRAAPRRTLSQSGSTRGSRKSYFVLICPISQAEDFSANPSNPTTPQLGGRRKLELLPRGSSTPPSAESPMTSPKSANAPSTKSNPFGGAKSVAVCCDGCLQLTVDSP